MTELRSCPFCGGEPEMISGGPGSHYVTCSGCGATTDDGSTERAIAAWNRRALTATPPPAKAGEGEAQHSDKLRQGLQSAVDSINSRPPELRGSFKSRTP